MKKTSYYLPVPVRNQAYFTMVAVFRESVEYVRDYTCPFNMIGIHTRSEGKNASVVTNLLTGERHASALNEITLCPFNLPQNYRHTLRDEHLSIHFKLELFPGVDVYSGQERCFREVSPELTRKAEEIFAVREPVQMLSLCQEFALHFCHRHWPERYAFELEKIRRFQDVLEFIRRKADAGTEMEELARVVRMSLSTFTREFHHSLGISPKRFLQQEIYRKASLLLLNPEASVKSAAAALGFTSEFYFSHFFKRMSGVSPKEYRQRTKTEQQRKMN